MRWIALLVTTLLLTVCAASGLAAASSERYILTVPIPDRSGTGYSSSTRVYGAGDRWRMPLEVRKKVRLLVRDHNLTVLDTWPLNSIGEFCVVVTGKPADIRGLGLDSRIASLQPVQTFTAMKSRPPYNDPQLDAQLGADVESFHRLHTWSTGKGVSHRHHRHACRFQPPGSNEPNPSRGTVYGG